MSTAPSSTDFIKAAIHTASHYGFTSANTLLRDKQCKHGKRTAVKRISAADRKLDELNGILTSGISTYYDGRLYALEKPVLFFSIESVPRTGEVALSLQVIGVDKSIAEALLIQTVRSLLFDMGYVNTYIRINSLGDRDSMTRYSRELANFLKKRLNDMPAASRERMKEHAISALQSLIEHEHELAYRSPSPLEYLSDASRKHFREIVEYLDMTETPYEIDANLIRHHHCYSDALFSIDMQDESGNLLEHAPFKIDGGRYDEFVRRTTKTQVPATGAVVTLRDRKTPSRIPNPRQKTAPAVFVVQLGFGPKIKSLMLIDQLKRAGIPVYQNVVSDSLSEQLKLAEQYGTPYSLILGQKEYVEETVILRDMKSRSQECYHINELIPHLKKTLQI